VRRDEPIVHISTRHAEPPIDWLRLKLLLREPWNDCVLVSGLAAGPQTSVSLPPAWLGAAIAASSASVAPAIAFAPAAPIPRAFEQSVERQWHAFTCILLCIGRGTPVAGASLCNFLLNARVPANIARFGPGRFARGFAPRRSDADRLPADAAPAQ
jgi:hypothetical protein